MFRAYLVDDELPALKRLERLLKEAGRVEITGSATNPAAAIECICSDPPDVVFLDIQMPGMTGFELLERITAQPIVIFTTAYDQYALKAFEVNSIDYLLKPIEPEQLHRALNKLEQLQCGQPHLLDRPEIRQLLRELSRTLAKDSSDAIDRIPIQVGERTRFLEIASISHFFTQGRLTFAASGGKSYCVEWTITELEQKLAGTRFFRIHRGTLLNLDWLDELTPWFTGRMSARLKDAARTELTVARDRVRLLRTRLGIS
ncbi:MAG TPA: LytTR family DNA-binding domain-containing protein [Bryobacteraceae bacterium]|nr:LytTR family DNA-binding domain-containing protein [Bryobacteraceae bacterium]